MIMVFLIFLLVSLVYSRIYFKFSAKSDGCHLQLIAVIVTLAVQSGVSD